MAKSRSKSMSRKRTKKARKSKSMKKVKRSKILLECGKAKCDLFLIAKSTKIS